MVIRYTSENIIIWNYGEKYLTSNEIVKYYTSIYDDCFIEFDDDAGDLVFDNITIELDKNQYKNLNKVINRQISNKRETLIDDVYNRLLNKIETPNNRELNTNSISNNMVNSINSNMVNNMNNNMNNNVVNSMNNSISTNNVDNSRCTYIEKPRSKYINNSKCVDFFYVYKRN